jgi:hypothetical protein
MNKPTPKAGDDRAAQRELLAALNASDLALRRDECGDWRINGKHGHIYTWGASGGFVLYVACNSGRGWASAKRKLGPFTKISQDGDAEGCFRLPELPTKAQAAAIREVLGIKRRRTVTDAARKSLLAARLKRQERAKSLPVAPDYQSVENDGFLAR